MAHLIDYNPPINNGGFETAGSPIWTNWYIDNVPTSTTFDDTTNQYEGSHCAAMYTDASSHANAIFSSATLIKGVQYNFSFWAKKTEAGSQMIGAGDYDNDVLTGFTITTSWALYSGIFVAGSSLPPYFGIKRDAYIADTHWFIDAVRLWTANPFPTFRPDVP